MEFTLDVSSLAFLSGAFAWIRSITLIYCDLLAEFTTLRVPILKPLLKAKPLQAQSAKMAQKLKLPNPQNNTHKKYNFLSVNMLNSLIRHNPPTGTSFAYLLVVVRLVKKLSQYARRYMQYEIFVKGI